MKTATIRDLRTRFPKIRRILEEEGELVVTDRGRPVILMRPYRDPSGKRVSQIDYYARLRRFMPEPLSAASAEALDEANRAER